MNDEGVYRTAPATPGLVNTKHGNYFTDKYVQCLQVLSYLGSLCLQLTA